MKRKALSILVLCLNLALCASSQKKLEQQRTKDPKFQYNVGLFYLNEGNVDEALKYLDKSLSLNPRYYLAWNARGLAYSMKGDLPEAVKSFQKCLESDPTFTEAHNNLGSIYQEMGFLDKAEEEYKKALSDPTYQSRELPYYNLARLYYGKEKYEQTLDYLQKSLQINSRMALAHNLKGLTLEKLNRLEEAISCYEQALKIVPEDLNFSYSLAVAYFKNGEFNKAGEIFERIAPKVSDPDTSEKIRQYLKIIKEK